MFSIGVATGKQLLAMPSTLTDTQGLTVVSLVSSASPVKRESS